MNAARNSRLGENIAPDGGPGGDIIGVRLQHIDNSWVPNNSSTWEISLEYNLHSHDFTLGPHQVKHFLPLNHAIFLVMCQTT